MKRENLNVLVVEDSLNDQLLLQCAFEHCAEPGLFVHFARSGKEAIQYLNGEGRFRDRSAYPFPSFLITDLKMADGDGFSVLKHLQTTSHLCIFPTIVLSGSADDDDVKTSYAMGASAYLVKPAQHEELIKLLRALLDFWKACEVPEVNAKGECVATQYEGKLSERIQAGTHC